jgi:hypothetical protein
MTMYERGFLTKCAEYGVPYESSVILLEKSSMWIPPMIARGVRRIGKWISAPRRATLAVRRGSHMANMYGRMAQEAVDSGAGNAAQAVARHKRALEHLKQLESRFGRIVDYSGNTMGVEMPRTFPYEGFRQGPVTGVS